IARGAPAPGPRTREIIFLARNGTQRRCGSRQRAMSGVRFSVFAAAVAILALAFAWACAAFVRQPTLAGFADDSVSYLVMAQVFPPYLDASPPALGARA